MFHSTYVKNGFKESFFSCEVLAGTVQNNNFKCIYSNQFQRYEYVEDLEDAEFYEKDEGKKILARVQFCARIDRMFCLLGPNIMIS